MYVCTSNFEAVIALHAINGDGYSLSGTVRFAHLGDVDLLPSLEEPTDNGSSPHLSGHGEVDAHSAPAPTVPTLLLQLRTREQSLRHRGRCRIHGSLAHRLQLRLDSFAHHLLLLAETSPLCPSTSAATTVAVRSFDG